MSILSLYFLAASSPSKGDVFGSEVSVCINPLALRALPPISSAMSTGRDDQALITSPCIFYPSVQRKPPLYFAQQNTGGRGGVTWPNNRQSVYNSSLNTIKKLLRTSHLHDSYRIHFLLSQKKFTFSLGITLDLRLILYSA